MRMKTLNELEEAIIQWADDKGILESASPAAQYEKTVEEVGELGRALIEQADAYRVAIESDGSYDGIDGVRPLCQIEDAIGDIIVTLVIQAKMQGTSIQECVSQAYEVIAKRSGKMVNGVFVKDGT